jgi:hypothetical protein
MGESRHQGTKAASPAEAPGEAAPDTCGEPELCAEERERRRGGIGRVDPLVAGDEDVEGDATFGGEALRKVVADHSQPVVQWKVTEGNKESRKMAVLTPEGVQCIGVRA